MRLKNLILTISLIITASAFAVEPDILVTQEGETLKVYNLDINPTGNVYYTTSEEENASLQKMAIERILIIKRADGTTWTPGQNVSAVPAQDTSHRRINPGEHPAVTFVANPNSFNDNKKQTFFAKGDNGQTINFRILNNTDHTLAVAKMPKGTEYLDEKYIIPEYVKIGDEVYTVVQIDKEAFEHFNSFWGSGDNTIKEVVFPSTLKIIEEKAFIGNEGLKSILLPDGLEKIGKMAFGVCGRQAEFEELYIPESVKHIGDEAFRCVSPHQSYRGYCQGNVTSLPRFVNTNNCTDYGIDEEAVENYERKYMK